ncbi:hypothetical protein [Actinomadura napierensis]|uniref:Uncharacterized protein n=1 Tax=Actinomadura napierensis TaxID=267854 RepID=A0ABP5KYS0_9ACTN
MRLKSLIAAVALGVGLAGTGLATAEADTTAPNPTTSPGPLQPSRPGDRPAKSGERPSKSGERPIAMPPGKAIPKTPNYTG